MFVLAHEKYKETIGKQYTDVETIRTGIRNHLYDEKNGVFKLSDQRAGTSQLANSLAILAGVEGADEKLAAKLIEDVKNKWSADGGMTKASLSMKAFLYDALLSFNKPEYNKVVEDDIRFYYNKMMNAPYFSGTFWEDELGQAAFDNAGSLCHG